MKEIIITQEKLKRERNFYLLSFILSFIINVTAVILYKRPWSEIYSQIGYIVAISVFLYFLIIIPRVFITLLFRLFRKK
jgi:hypothetical protein